MDHFYDSEGENNNEVFKEETYVVKAKDAENDIPIKWKEATTQMDYVSTMGTIGSLSSSLFSGIIAQKLGR